MARSAVWLIGTVLLVAPTASPLGAQVPPAVDARPPAGAVGKTLIGRLPDEHYFASIETWRAGRIQRLTSPTGWLALIGRHPLPRGTSTVGADEGNAIRLAAGPGKLGSIRYNDDGKVTFALAEGVAATIDGTTARTAELVYKGDKPTYVRSGTINFYILESGGKLFVRVRDSEAARRKNFAGIEHFPVSLDWRIEADWVPYDPPRQLRITNVAGITEDSPCPGKAVFAYQGRTYELLPVLEEGEERLFFIISDATAGTETYEASRFFYADPPKDGKVILDFNKVYNPPCAFTPFTVCPLPPKENILPFRLTAGEKKYQGAH
ncbi:MAG TPA: DUF1684 domain-containing protein [Lacunisphaera sp.]|nr:DUF1684 domain-containing protein [Lacunisphaera sp.]